MPAQVYTTSAASTPSVSSSATALAANSARISWTIQNLGTNALYILKGSGASTTVFSAILAPGSAQDDGLGGFAFEDGPSCYTGIITVAGTSPRYTAQEMAP